MFSEKYVIHFVSFFKMVLLNDFHDHQVIRMLMAIDVCELFGFGEIIKALMYICYEAWRYIRF